MSDDLGHYFEVAAVEVDPRRREAVAAVAPLLVADLRLPALGLRGGLVVKWFRATSRMQFAPTYPGAPPVEAFVQPAGDQGPHRGKDPDGTVWLDADLPVSAGAHGLLWCLAHEAKHVQHLLTGAFLDLDDAATEQLPERYAERFCAALKGEGQLRPGIRATPSKPKAAGTPKAPDVWGPGHPNWRIPWQYE